MHDMICKEARYCLGVDIEKAELSKLREKGYNVKFADVEKMDLGKKFDVVVAGELIEHLSNPGSFVERTNLHLKKNGILILTTPNPLSFGIIYKKLLGKNVRVHDQHTCFFDAQTLGQLLNRYGFEVEEVYWHIRPEARMHTFINFRPELAPTFIMIAKKIKGVDIS
jgi:2-polyprenyl-3-methyl-5-hydroxy-6-metoxy-1,4-benzoquinol methylase